MKERIGCGKIVKGGKLTIANVMASAKLTSAHVLLLIQGGW